MNHTTLPTFGIVTFMRRAKLFALIDSARSRYPLSQIVVADNGRKLPASIDEFSWWPYRTSKCHILPYDCGLSASRNFLVSQTSGDLLILDDDFEFTDETRIERMQDVLCDDPEIGIVCGDAGFTNPMNFVNGRTQSTRHHTIRTAEGTDYILCDLADNFMLVRRELFNDGIRWNPELKTGEHRDFFEKVFRSKWKVAFCPSVKIKHNRQGDSHEYGVHRSRCSKFHRGINQRQRGIAGQRIVAVVGPYRGGTSCVAGILHKLGVSMGDDFRPPKTANPTGFYESERLIQICHQSFPEPELEEKTTRAWRIEQLKQWAATRPTPAIIGAKHPNLCLMIPEMVEAWPDVRIVRVSRDTCDTIQSLTNLGWGWPAEKVNEKIPWMKSECGLALRSADVPWLTFPYSLCINDPTRAVSFLADFAGITPTDVQRQAAIDHVRPELCHYGKPNESNATRQTC